MSAPVLEHTSLDVAAMAAVIQAQQVGRVVTTEHVSHDIAAPFVLTRQALIRLAEQGRVEFTPPAGPNGVPVLTAVVTPARQTSDSSPTGGGGEPSRVKTLLFRAALTALGLLSVVNIAFGHTWAPTLDVYAVTAIVSGAVLGLVVMSLLTLRDLGRVARAVRGDA